ncbi:DMT family transporter [Pantoea agglomerans]|uniref:DMT family transporter n=1 Tax=Enterobacter agglomerans TaxID=549 RepID=UPI0013CC9143|nr:DMT family transporter [Pantoea agglomerans]NEG59757.1 EamA family transporter [Pantoea agglomerans]NEH05295.1 EamA family transporter [Pantoea agglomerans]NEH16329.1 EamA family transporter [Pantoea agglomerans]
MERLNSSKPGLAFLALSAIFVNILWGTPFPLVKEMYLQMNISPVILGNQYNGQVLTTISIRFFLAGLITLMMAKLMGHKILEVTPRQWYEVTSMGVVSTTAAYLFFNIGLVNTTTIKSTILAQSSIFFSIILAHFAYKNDKINQPKAIGLMLGLAGLLIVNLMGAGSDLHDLLNFSWLGDGFMILYGLVAALGMMQAKSIGSSLNSFIMTGWNLTIGSVILFIIGIMMGGKLSVITWTPITILLMLILALIASVAFGLWYWIVQHAKIGEISIYKFCMPLSGSLLSVFMGQDDFTLPLTVGLILVCIGIVIVNTPPKFLQCRVKK